VRAFGGLTLYEARGEYQMVVRRLEAEDAEGLWRQAFDRLRSKLEAEGLLAPSGSVPCRVFPRPLVWSRRWPVRLSPTF
jgi:exodeoxyribonuclease VII large subunit